MVTTCSEFPKDVERYFLCVLLHKRRPIWDGDYRYDEFSKKNVPNIRWVCDICDQCKADLHD